MYNKELEELIDAALEDGVLTEKEKQVLFKRAQSMGIDLDEFEMVLDARLVKLQKEEKAKVQVSAPKSDKYGDVKKCPSCGAIVQTFRGVCPECGYAFEGVAANSSSQKLAEKIDAIMRETSIKTDEALSKNNYGIFGTLMEKAETRAEKVEESGKKRIREIIKNFPIPNTKSDLMEFIITMKTKSQNGPFSSAYFSKYTECIDKAKYVFPNDKDFAPLIAAYSKRGGFARWWNSKSKEYKQIVFAIVAFSIIIGAGAIASVLK